MSTTSPPALRLDRVVVRASVASTATTHAPRDLPNLARFLMDAIAPDGERAHKLLDRVSLDVAPGERVVLLGEEGCGKTTLARACARLLAIDAGAIEVGGIDLARRRRLDRVRVRRALPVIFDDAEHGFDPRRSIAVALRDACDALALGRDGIDIEDASARAAARAHLPADALRVPAGALAAGLRARAAVARALLARPVAIVIDEPTARLDPLERAALLEALVGLAAPTSADGDAPALLVLTQRPDVVRALAQRVGVLYLGVLIEVGGVDLLESPRHPYTRALLEAAPRRSRPSTARAIAGELPAISERPAGCPFHPRCPEAVARCTTERPTLIGDARLVACHVVNQATSYERTAGPSSD